MILSEKEREDLRRRLLDAGCCVAGFARAEETDVAYRSELRNWLEQGQHASMDYMKRNEELRHDPRKILPEARSAISVGIPYLPREKRDENAPQVALYTSGKDYHKQVVKLLRPVCKFISETYGATTRICVDTAPVAERYWALKAGIGVRGRNGCVIVPRYGSYIFLAEIITSLEILPDPPSKKGCMGCGACEKICPGKALKGEGTVDARRCLSYLTIEHRGEYSLEQQKILNTPAGRNTIYGCDLCQKVCPHNRYAVSTDIEAFEPTELWLSLNPTMIATMTAEEWDKATQGSAMRRADFQTLKSRWKK